MDALAWNKAALTAVSGTDALPLPARHGWNP